MISFINNYKNNFNSYMYTKMNPLKYNNRNFYEKVRIFSILFKIFKRM